MLAPITKNITIFKGITFKLKFKVKTRNCCDGTGVKTPIDLSEYDVFMQIRKKECGTDEHELILDLNDHTPPLILVTNEEEGEITINIPSSITKELSSPRTLIYWIVLRHKVTEESFILMMGDVTLVKPIVVLP